MANERPRRLSQCLLLDFDYGALSLPLNCNTVSLTFLDESRTSSGIPLPAAMEPATMPFLDPFPIDSYERDRLLGEGAQGKVYLFRKKATWAQRWAFWAYWLYSVFWPGHWDLPEFVAVKKILSGDTRTSDLPREIAIMKVTHRVIGFWGKSVLILCAPV